MIGELTQQSIELARVELPYANISPTQADGAQYVDLPFAPTADYRLKLWFYPDGQRDIAAVRLDARGQDLVPMPHFWHHPFELDDYERSPIVLAQAFDTRMVSLLHVRTRVLLQRGWLMSNLLMEREESPGTWLRGHVAGYLGPSRLERMPAREHVFSAPRLDHAWAGAPGA